MPLNEKALAKALDSDDLTIHSNLCRSQLSVFENALNKDPELIVACTQEASLFQEIAEEHGRQNNVSFVNIRENAGWSDEGKNASAKIAALLKSAHYEAEPARLKSITSDGLCLVYGSGQQALEAANLLSDKLSVTLLLSDQEDLVLSSISDVPIYTGKIETVEGSFGEFSLNINDYAPLMPSSRDSLNFVMARDGAKTQCSLILDLSGETPLVSGHTHRDGYMRADPGDPASVLKAVIKLSDMVGEFEKPIYVDYNKDTCAHARSQKVGCTKCLDVCPAGAVSDAGDIVEIDSGICGGCGSCHSVCPTGSISYQYPQRADIIEKSQDILENYLDAGGKQPVLLMHDTKFGEELISAISRFGRGLPAKVIPVSMHSVSTLGHVELLGLVASGAEQILILGNPNTEDTLDGLNNEVELSQSILAGLDLGEERVTLLSSSDPEEVEKAIWNLPIFKKFKSARFRPNGTKREVARIVFGKLKEVSKSKVEIITLPTNAPYGKVEINQSACTLCMACTSACPSSAIIDTPGEPALRFVERACVQCGLCVKTCPEKALSLQPQINFSSASMQPVILYEEEPFHCIVCDTPFATKSTIERISNQLGEKHAMFASAERADLIKMCQDCRVEAQANSSQDPFASKSRPMVRTTDDYINAEKGLTSDDFLKDD